MTESTEVRTLLVQPWMPWAFFALCVAATIVYHQWPRIRRRR